MTGQQTSPETSLRSTPNAEKYVLEADALRRRQLQSALIHGSQQTWRERRRVWPATIGGAIAIIIIVAVVAITGAFQRQQQIIAQKERQQEQLRQRAQNPEGAANQRNAPQTSPESVCNRPSLKDGVPRNYQRHRQEQFAGGAVHILHDQQSGHYCIVLVKTTALDQPTELWYRIDRFNGATFTPVREHRKNVHRYTGTFVRRPGACWRIFGGTPAGQTAITWGNCPPGVN